MLKRTLFAATVVGLLAATAGTAAAQVPPGYTPETHEHNGFFLRALLGLGYFSASAEDALGIDYKASGASGSVGLAVGAAVSRNLAVFGELLGHVATGPELEVAGQGGTADEDVSAGVYGLGVGVSYFLMPANVYFSGTLSFSQFQLQEDMEVIGETDFGPGLSLVVGKEWWVGRNVGIGVAGTLFYGRQPEKDDSMTWTTSAMSVAFSLTVN